MAPSTALLLVLLGTAVFFCAGLPRSRAAYWSGMSAGAAAVLVGVLLLSLSHLGILLEAERIGFAVDGTVGLAPIGHMSRTTALGFVLGGSSLVATLGAVSGRSRPAMAGFWLAAVMLLGAIVFLLAYLFGKPLLYGGVLIPPALTTSMALAALGAALIAFAGPRAWGSDQPVDGQTLRSSLLFVLVFVLLAVGLVGAGGIYFRSYMNQTRALAERELLGIADFKVSELVNWRMERFGDAKLLHRNALFAELVRRAFSDSRDARAWNHLRSWLQLLRETYGYEAVYLADTQGVARISVPGGATNARESERIRRVARSGEVTLDDFHRDGPEGAPHLSLLVPVPDETTGGAPRAVVVLEIDPAKYLYPSLERWPTLSSTAETLLVRRDGNDVLYLNELRFRKNVALSVRVPLTRTDRPAVKAVLGQQGIVEGTDYRGEPTIAALRAVPGTPWFLVARMETAEFMGPIERSLWLTALLVSALLAASGASVGLIWRQQRVRHYKERSRAAEALAAGAARYRAVSQTAADAIVTADSSGTIVGWNAGAERIFGYGEVEALKLPIARLMPERYRQRHLDGFHRVRNGGERRVIGGTVELHGLTRTGIEFPLELSLSAWDTFEGKFFTAIIRDITERKRAEKALAHQKDLYDMLSQTNQAIVRMTSRDELFPAVCRIAVQYGHFRFAWIGLTGNDGQWVSLAAKYGEDAGYLERLRVSADATDPAGRGPAGQALRTGQRAASNDFLGDPATAPWHDAARLAGVRASAALPIRQGGKVIGVIVLSAGEPGFFTEALWPTLDEMAVDVSFALDNFEREAERSRALEAVRESEERFRGLVEQSLVGIVIVDRDAVVLYSNPRAAEILGCAQSEVHGQSYRQWIVDADWPLVERQLGLVMSGEVTVGKVEFTARRKDGRNVVIGGQGVRTLYKGQPALLGVMQDISEKKHAEEQIQRHVTELESAFMSTVNVAATLSEMRDPYTAGHERRVAEIAVAIGAALGLDARRQEGLRVAGYLHDVGKISIPAEILAKPGKLTKIEYQLIQAHPQAGHDVLKDVNFPWPVAQVALQHHERIDGTGYPQGLKGDQILIEARIMAVADVVEAMATHRPYRPGLGIDRALAEIERGRGSAYDTGVADACLRLFREKSYKIPE
jgi:PAS domain S-box-containing protein